MRARPVDTPNVVLVVLDAVRPDHLSCYGYWRPTTPNLERLCERDATRYTRAHSTSAWTPPAHASLFTGRYPSRHGVLANLPLPPEVPTLAECLRRRGYYTAGLANMFHVSRQRGFARGHEYYFTPFDLRTMRIPLLGERAVEFSSDMAAYLFARLFYDYDPSWRLLRKAVRQMRVSHPFYLFLNLNSAHSPYRAPRPFQGRFVRPRDLEGLDIARLRGLARRAGYAYMAGAIEVSEREWNVLRGWYDEEIAWLDHLLGRMIAFLQRSGQYDNTLLIITADHGEQFGEHGLAYHTFGLYEGATRVPLIVKWPTGLQAAGGAEDDRLASLADVLPTICQIAGATGPPDVDGSSLLEAPDPQRPVFAEYYAGRALWDLVERYAAGGAAVPGHLGRALQAVWLGQRKLIVSSDGTVELYDLAADPEESANLAAREPETVALLRELIEEHLLHPDQWSPEENEVHDDQVRRHLQALGYL